MEAELEDEGGGKRRGLGLRFWFSVWRIKRKAWLHTCSAHLFLGCILNNLAGCPLIKRNHMPSCCFIIKFDQYETLRSLSKTLV
jgi:hypothetical protein